MNPSEKLDQLAEFQFLRDAIVLRKQELIDSILAPEIKTKLEEIEVEFSGQVEAVEQMMVELSEQIKTEVLKEGASLKGRYLQAVYQKGRVSWDTKRLEGLMMVIPQVAEARREGEPSALCQDGISIRRIG